MKLLLISNSTNAGEEYLEHPKNCIRSFLGDKSIHALFIPYAGVTVSYDQYVRRVQGRFREMGHDIVSIHKVKDPVKAVRSAPAIVIGGGNTWQLIKQMQDKALLAPIREKVLAGTPYIGWSAGANVACPTIRTTNDMPIIQPTSFQALGLIPFQINPHYLDVNPEGHAGETREARIQEFIEINPGIYVVGLREGTMLWLENESLKLLGPRKARVFLKGKKPRELGEKDDFGFLLRESP
jgi:dipeptidase E